MSHWAVAAHTTTRGRASNSQSSEQLGNSHPHSNQRLAYITQEAEPLEAKPLFSDRQSSGIPCPSFVGVGGAYWSCLRRDSGAGRTVAMIPVLSTPIFPYYSSISPEMRKPLPIQKLRKRQLPYPLGYSSGGSNLRKHQWLAILHEYSPFFLSLFLLFSSIL